MLRGYQSMYNKNAWGNKTPVRQSRYGTPTHSTHTGNALLIQITTHLTTFTPGGEPFTRQAHYGESVTKQRRAHKSPVLETPGACHPSPQKQPRRNERQHMTPLAQTGIKNTDSPVCSTTTNRGVAA